MSPTKTKKQPAKGNQPTGPASRDLTQARSIVGFDFGQYSRTFMDRSGADPLNDAASLGVRVIPADVAPGQTYWQIIGVHHLTPEENKGKHNLFLLLLLFLHCWSTHLRSLPSLLDTTFKHRT